MIEGGWFNVSTDLRVPQPPDSNPLPFVMTYALAAWHYATYVNGHV